MASFWCEWLHWVWRVQVNSLTLLFILNSKCWTLLSFRLEHTPFHCRTATETIIQLEKLHFIHISHVFLQSSWINIMYINVTQHHQKVYFSKNISVEYIDWRYFPSDFQRNTNLPTSNGSSSFLPSCFIFPFFHPIHPSLIIPHQTGCHFYTQSCPDHLIAALISRTENGSNWNSPKNKYIVFVLFWI